MFWYFFEYKIEEQKNEVGYCHLVFLTGCSEKQIALFVNAADDGAAHRENILRLLCATSTGGANHHRGVGFGVIDVHRVHTVGIAGVAIEGGLAIMTISPPHRQALAEVVLTPLILHLLDGGHRRGTE